MKKLKLGSQTGSFYNWLMSGNNEAPVVGKGATKLMWTDRHAYFVNWVSEDQKTCHIRRATAIRTDKLGMSDMQGYKYEDDPEQVTKVLKFKWGSWKVECQEIKFTKEFIKECEKREDFSEYRGYSNYMTQEQQDLVWNGEHQGMQLVEGITRKATVYNKINIAFGYMAEYYDYSF
jgi:hypothetical protein